MTRITRAQARQLGIPDEDLPKERKYRNEPTEVMGISFDSKKEAERYRQLELLQRAGEIFGLEVHPKLPLIVINPKSGKATKVADYEADFSYWHRGEDCILTPPTYEDVKSPITRRNPIYRLKKKIIEAYFGIKILET